VSFVDPELERMGRPPEFLQPLLLLVVAAFACFLGYEYVDELAYSFSDSDPITLGAAEELPQNVAWMQDGQLMLPSNRYVSVDGAAERRSASDRYVYYKLLGSQIYVQTEPETMGREVNGEWDFRPERGREDYREIRAGGGRLVAFEDLPKRYEGILQYYSEGYQLEFCGFEPSPTLRNHLVTLRLRTTEQLREELGREPTDDEINDRLGRAAECQRAYLLFAGVEPADYRYFIGLFALLGFITGGCFFFVWRWVRRSLLGAE
jgi:hypothetical protein